MSFPRPDEADTAYLNAVLPADPQVQVKPMFGNLAGFANGYMFAGLFGHQLFVRLPEHERQQLVAQGGSDFAPMPGRPMKEYVVVPDAWRDEPDRARGWVELALQQACALPAKESGAKTRRK